MRRIIWLMAILAVLWSGCWALMSWGLSRGADFWLTNMRAEGWQAEVSSITSGGFPARARVSLNNLILEHDRTGVTLTAPLAEMNIPVPWPGNVTINIPAADLLLVPLSGGVEAAQAHLYIAPTPSLPLGEIRLQSGPWRINTHPDAPFKAQGTVARIVKTEGDATYRATLVVNELSPGGAMRAVLGVEEDWPRAFEVLDVDITATLDRPLDRHLADGITPQPRRVQIDRAEAIWGPLRIAIQGAVDIDAEGIPEGALRLELRSWERLLDLAEQGGALPPEIRQQANIMFRLLSNSGAGGPENLDLQLRFEEGQMYLGEIRLRSAPRIILR
jgi:hypothetical protein